MRKRKEVKGLEVFFEGPEGRREVLGIKTELHTNAKTQELNEVKAEERKERVNYYIDSRLVEAIDKVQAEIRSIIKKKITKSDIVSVALEQALREFKEKGKESALVKALLKT
ncbi:MAG: hypothetical protein ABDI20_08705 [Candidatus Bipolaricaulaceae bacterium]